MSLTEEYQQVDDTRVNGRTNENREAIQLNSIEPEARIMVDTNSSHSWKSTNKVAPSEAQAIPGQMTLDNVDLRELGFSECKTEEEQLKQLKKLKELPCPVAAKRVIRKRLLGQHVKMMSGWKGWKARRKMERKRCSLACKNFSYKLELWSKSFKEIESHFGGGVLSYFLFLKWLFQLNMLIFITVFLFIVIPQISLGTGTATYNTPCTEANESLYTGLEWYGNIVPNCTARYQTYVATVNDVSNVSNHALKYVADFFQGTGFMEDTVLFYGFYSSVDLSVSISVISNYVNSYNMPLAYIAVTAVYFIISLILMIRQSAAGFRESVSSGEDKYYKSCNTVFSTWDFTLSDSKNAYLKMKSIYTDITHNLHEQRDLNRRQMRSGAQKCAIWTLRIIINILVLAALAGSGYLIYYMTQLSSEIITTWPEYSSWSLPLQFLVEFMPSLTITLLNIIVPVVFEKVVVGEDYSPAVEIRITLFRTVFLKFASLGILFATLYSEINCPTKDDCNVGRAPCQTLHCWETGIGQQLYKLVVTDFIVPIASTLLAEFPRKLIASRCSCKLATIIGYQEFNIPKNVLDLVYSQALCWLATFFSPLIPGITIVKFIILFYIKKLSLLSNFVPNKRPFNASGANSFFITVLLVSFLICLFPVIYVIAIMTPSRGCGPFRPYEAMYDAFTVTVCEWSSGFQSFLSVVSSAVFNIPVLMVLCITIYYQHILNKAQKERVEILKDQLTMEGKDKKFLVDKLNSFERSSDATLTVREKQRQAMNMLINKKMIGRMYSSGVVEANNQHMKFHQLPLNPELKVEEHFRVNEVMLKY